VDLGTPLLVHRFCTASAPLLHRFCTASAPLLHRFCTASAPLLHRFCRHACEDRYILTDELKGRLAFDGWVVSDWGATHSTVASSNAGLDMEMGAEKYFGKALVAAVNSGAVPEAAVDEKAERVLRTMIRVCL
jgi:beta-glucosidase-like glycosyl hydrolase